MRATGRPCRASLVCELGSNRACCGAAGRGAQLLTVCRPCGSHHASPPAPLPAHADPIALLVDAALVASWVRQGLPSDPTSVGNGAILVNSERWPLMMDPQLQGVLWIKEREAKNGLQVRPGVQGHVVHVCQWRGQHALCCSKRAWGNSRMHAPRVRAAASLHTGGRRAGSPRAGHAHGRRQHDGRHRARHGRRQQCAD